MFQQAMLKPRRDERRRNSTGVKEMRDLESSLHGFVFMQPLYESAKPELFQDTEKESELGRFEKVVELFTRVPVSEMNFH
jgi:hypothetical protein